MDVPTDRLLIMVVVATGLAVLIGGWAGGLVQAETGGWTEIGLYAGLGLLFFAALLGLWYVFGSLDDDSA